MGRGSNDDGRDATLKRLHRMSFRGVYLKPHDALVAAAPVPGGPAPPVRARLDVPFPHRLFPVDSGFLVKWPYEGESYDPAHFRVEHGGWDHEHCDACGSTIGAGAECWFTEGESTSILCGPCYDRVSELPDA